MLSYVLLFAIFVTRTALQAATLTAIGLVVLDFVLGVFLFVWGQSLL